jgi:hypothetical protein
VQRIVFEQVDSSRAGLTIDCCIYEVSDRGIAAERPDERHQQRHTGKPSL